jgi:hypothetical protein
MGFGGSARGLTVPAAGQGEVIAFLPALHFSRPAGRTQSECLRPRVKRIVPVAIPMLILQPCGWRVGPPGGAWEIMSSADANVSGSRADCRLVVRLPHGRES